MTELPKVAAARLVRRAIDDGFVPVALHTYTDAEAHPLYFKARLKHPSFSSLPKDVQDRYDGKDKYIRPMKLNGEGYVLGEPKFDGGKPLYKLHQIVPNPDAVVWITEGEQKVDALEKLGIVATTSGSAASAKSADWSPLAGRHVVIWPDNDEPGEAYAGEVAKILLEQSCKVHCVEIDKLGLGIGEDVMEWLAAHPSAVQGDIEALPMLSVQPEANDAPASDFDVPAPITMLEWTKARLTPDCIVQTYLYADVAVFISPGGMGKTTLKLFEAIHIALGMNLYGQKIHRPGYVYIITAEDGREILVARLRLIAEGMGLTEDQTAIVMERVRISDVSGSRFKLTEVISDVVVQSAGVDRVIEACQEFKPVLIVIDPTISFGVGEKRVNDAEQALIEAARKIRKTLNCVVQFVHHTGKANAREKTVDQYSGRGGSAMADGARMVHVLQSLTPKEWADATGTKLLPGETGLKIARPKMSYCPPQDDILIRRRGYAFEPVQQYKMTGQEKSDSITNQVWQFMHSELNRKVYHSKNTLESQTETLNLNRSQIRAALGNLIAAQRIETRDLPNVGPNGKREYLHPVASPSENGEPTPKSTENE